MRKVEYSKFRKENLKKAALLRAKIFDGFSRKVRKRPRPKEEWEIFLILTKKRMERMEKTGKIRQIGERRYKIKL